MPPSSSHPTDDDANYKLIQVRPKTKVPRCAEACLRLLTDNIDQRPICIHTLPPQGIPIEDIQETITQSRVNPDKNAVGRVISIVEIIKRNFPEASDKEDGSCQLHQYNQFGSLEDVISERSKDLHLSETERKLQLIQHQEKVLKEFLNEERKRPRCSHTPWLKIYLSKKRIPSLEKNPNISYQKPSGPVNKSDQHGTEIPLEPTPVEPDYQIESQQVADI